MSNVALGITFSAEQHQQLLLLQQDLLRRQGLFQPLAPLLYVNIASWQLPDMEIAQKIIGAVNDIQQMQLSVFPIINLSASPPQVCLQVINTHILTNWHFDIHKHIELPYLGLYADDMPKRWRPLVSLGVAADSSVLHSSVWPKTLDCSDIVLIDLDQQVILGRQPLIKNDAIIW